MEPSRRAKLEIEGKMWKNAKLRLNADSRFTTTLDHQELCDRLLILERFMQKHCDYEATKAREEFIVEKQKVLDGYVKEAMLKEREWENILERTTEKAKALLMKNFLPCVNNERKLWSDKIVDQATHANSPNILDMVIAVAPALIDTVDCIVNPARYLKWLTEDFARSDSPLVYEYTREITPEQRHQHVSEHVKINIQLRTVLIP